MADLDQKIIIKNAKDVEHEVSLRSLIYLRGSDMVELMNFLGIELDFADTEFQNILQRMLNRVPADLDRRQGSIIYDTLAAAAVELSDAYLEREAIRALGFASSSNGEWLDKKVAEHGLSRQGATAALRWGFFFADKDKLQYFSDVPIGSIYSINSVDYTVKEMVSEGVFTMECTQKGNIGNIFYGELLPKDYIQGLAVAELGAPIKPGEDQESDDALYQRFVEWITRPPFGGNRSDYHEYFRKIEGIGSVKLFRADPEKGYVRAIILGADWLPPDDDLVESTQEKIDPYDHQGQGLGMAPMCHNVTVYGAKGKTIDISANLRLLEGVTLNHVEGIINSKLAEYFESLRIEWANYITPDRPYYVETAIIKAKIETLIFENAGIRDVRSILIDNQEDNLILAEEEVPILGQVILNT